jgi:hypothetical protein
VGFQVNCELWQLLLLARFPLASQLPPARLSLLANPSRRALPLALAHPTCASKSVRSLLYIEVPISG